MASYIGQQPARQSIVSDDAITSAKIFDGTVAGADLASDITISTTGTITTSQVNLGDSEKIRLGASQDLEIYHSGNDSIIKENGTGWLYVIGSNIQFQNSAQNNVYADFNDGGSVELYYSGSKKFETTNTGATVTGTLVADGLTVDTDTLFVDSSNDRVGINTTTIYNTTSIRGDSLGIYKTSGTSAGSPLGGQLYLGDAAYYNQTYYVSAPGIGAVFDSQYSNSAALALYTYQNAVPRTERMRITGAGNVGIGTTSPSYKLEVTGDAYVSTNLTVGGNLTVQGTTTTVDSTTINIQNAFVFEGATADDFETTLTVTDPTADRTITLPDATGTVVLIDSTDTLTNKTINTASNTITIVESDISDLGAYLENVSEDTTPQLGGNLDLNSNDITGTGNINIIGTATVSGDLTVDTNTLYVDSTNNRVGVGTTSALSLLHIQKSNVAFTPNADYDHLIIENGTSTKGSVVQIVGPTDGVSELGFSDNIRNRGLVSYVHTTDHMALSTAGSEAMRIDSSGNVGIGTSSPSAGLEIENTTTAGTAIFKHPGNISFGTILTLETTGGTDDPVLSFKNYNGGSPVYYGISGTDDGSLAFKSGASTGGFGTERMRIDSSGNVGIGTTSPSSALTVSGVNIGAAIDWVNTTSGGRTYRWVSLNSGSGFAIEDITASAERMRVDSSGKVGIGTNSPQVLFHTRDDGSTEVIRAESGSGGTGGKIVLKTKDNADTSKYIMMSSFWTEIGVHNNEGLRMRNSSGNIKFSVSGAAGNCIISGSLSKGSGSFRIDHPLPEKKETHHLIHSFVEAPQADNIYRGKVDLVNGTATVNIDTVAGMTEGTFVLLNREIQCFTSNETGWTAVKGSVSGNILTITAQDETCTDTISWLVIGERQDQHMYDTEWTDENGKVIVEPLKPVEEEALENA